LPTLTVPKSTAVGEATSVTVSALVDPVGDPPNATTPPHPEIPREQQQITRTAISTTAFEFEFWQELNDRGAIVRRPDVGCISIPCIYHFSRANVFGIAKEKCSSQANCLLQYLEQTRPKVLLNAGARECKIVGRAFSTCGWLKAEAQGKTARQE
jgi:hypothetical protein